MPGAGGAMEAGGGRLQGESVERPGPLPRLAISGFSHALRNSLNAIGLTLLHAGRTLARERGGEEIAELVEHMELAAVEVDVARRAVLQLVELLGPTQLSLEEVGLARLLREVVNEERGRLSAERSPAVEVTVDAPAPEEVVGDPARLRAALAALLRNAFEALPRSGGQVRVCVEPAPVAVDSGGAECVRVTLEDSGSGFSKLALQRARFGFFSSKAERLGTGLAGARRIAEAHGGGVTVENLPRGGARVVFELRRDGEAGRPAHLASAAGGAC